ncbi:hypothetical protein [Cellulomonas sp. NPDC089187]|uniref:DUF7657 domain-containing protein n=1 Tax=Cellulomonas sp. NPDC089187 TaxID=3154970 RepID=UPI00341E8B9C
MSTDPTTEVSTPTWRRFLPSPWIGIPVLCYLLLTLFGITLSSIGAPTLREDPGNPPGDQLFNPALTRSDEYLTSTPLALGVSATGQSEDLNPLTAPQGFTTMLPSSPVSSVVLADSAMLRLGPWLPDQMLFAARWWLPVLLLVLGLPALLRPLVGSRWPGLFAAGLIAFAPATAWWSLSPLQLWGFTAAGAAALYRCATSASERRPWWRTVLWGMAAAWLLARTPLHYQPWMLVVAPAILAVGIVPLMVGREGRRRRIVAVVSVGVASLALAGAVFWENRASIAATSGTVYPGARVSTGAPVMVEQVFGATALADLRQLVLTDHNPSEISSGFTVAGIIALALLAVGVRFRSAQHRAAVWALLIAALPWVLWTTVNFGELGGRIPLANLVPPERAGTMIGFLAVLLLALVLPGWRQDAPWRVTVAITAAVILAAGYASSVLVETTLPDLSTKQIWLSLAVLGLVVAVIVSRPRWWGGYAAGSLAAFLLVWQVNPVLVGLGDLRGTATADAMIAEGERARDAGVVWATDDMTVDALLSATGVPSLSSRQMAGPDLDVWHRLDPNDDAERVWNRGGSYVEFDWTAEDELSFANVGEDRIVISGSPCAVAERMPELDRVVSSSRISAPCLSPVETFRWGALDRYVYQVS